LQHYLAIPWIGKSLKCEKEGQDQQKNGSFHNLVIIIW
jgi:hypothetical protein